VTSAIHESFENSASYIASWLRALRDDKRLVISAAAQAQRASDLVLKTSRQAEPGHQPAAPRQQAHPGPATAAPARPPRPAPLAEREAEAG